jgi:hypothetical protein
MRLTKYGTYHASNSRGSTEDRSRYEAQLAQELGEWIRAENLEASTAQAIPEWVACMREYHSLRNIKR